MIKYTRSEKVTKKFSYYVDILGWLREEEQKEEEEEEEGGVQKGIKRERDRERKGFIYFFCI